MNRVMALLAYPMGLLWWLHTPLFWWVRANVSPGNPGSELGLDRSQPVIYVLPNRSISDLLVLYHFCLNARLPLPKVGIHHLSQAGDASYIYLTKLGLWQPKKSGMPPTPLQDICSRLDVEKQTRVQLVPVSIIWGRNPGKEERSLFKLLFPDDEHAGILHKIFIVLAQGRDTFVHFGKPVMLREQVDQGPNSEQVAKKLRRVFRVHFRSQRNLTLGPKAYYRNRVLRSLFESNAIQSAIAEDARKSNQPIAKSEAKAWHYLREIAAQKNISVIRFFDVLLSYLWNKIYDGMVVGNPGALRELAKTCEIVYVPAHRSHLDYLILPYQLYYQGLNTPHIAAGVNLNFWPAGPILRRAGAFFIRRTFKGNRLYTTTFIEYLRYLLTKGHAIAYFPEGGRSRTGRLLAPKTGMLSMIVQTFLRDSSKPLVFVPVYIGYDKVMEVGSYLKELRGQAKKKESIGQLLNARRILSRNYGRAYIGFGDGVYLEDYLDEQRPNWRDETVDFDSKPEWFATFIDGLATSLMRGINAHTVISPVSMVASALLSSPQRALAQEELYRFIDISKKLISVGSNSLKVEIPDLSAQEMLKYTEKIVAINRFEYPGGGDVVYLNEVDSIVMSYYRNNLLHLMALPALIASYFQHYDEVGEQDLLKGCHEIYPFLRYEFFLKWEDEQVGREFKELIDVFVAEGLLVREEERLRRPDASSDLFQTLKILGRALGLVFERYGISAVLLAGLKDQGAVSRSEYEKQCQLLAQRISILNGVSDPEFYDKSLFRNYVNMLNSCGYLTSVGDRIEIDPRIDSLAEKCMSLLSPDIYQSIKRITS